MTISRTARNEALKLAGLYDIPVYPSGISRTLATANVEELQRLVVAHDAPWYVATGGKQRLCVLDIPTHFDRMRLENELGPLPPTVSSTRGCGEHLWFRV